MNEEELISCLLEYCHSEFEKARFSAKGESSMTGKSLESLLPLHLSKLYYRSMALLAQRDLEEEHIKNRR
jgi:hypothetical protein